jgi:hypothetical protein
VCVLCVVLSGIETHSMKIITPGAAEGKDDFWNGENTMDQAKEHLEFLHEFHPEVAACDIYDNSSGHGCMAKDALNIDKLNISPGMNRKTDVLIRDGYYTIDETKIVQNLFFEIGDTLRVVIKIGAALKKVIIASYLFITF